MDHSFTCNYTNACLYLVTVHQMAPPQTEVADIFYLPRTLNPCWLKASSSRVIIIEGVGGGGLTCQLLSRPLHLSTAPCGLM